MASKHNSLISPHNTPPSRRILTYLFETDHRSRPNTTFKPIKPMNLQPSKRYLPPFSSPNPSLLLGKPKPTRLRQWCLIPLKNLVSGRGSSSTTLFHELDLHKVVAQPCMSSVGYAQGRFRYHQLRRSNSLHEGGVVDWGCMLVASQVCSWPWP